MNIVNCTPHEVKLNNGKNYFNASNKIKIYSVAYPEWDGKSMLLYVLGQLHQLDEIILNATSKDFKKNQASSRGIQ